MKKILKSLLVLLLVLVPVTFAQAKKTTTTKTTTVAAKAPNTVNMYVFYGDGCPHCAELEEYIKSNLKKDARVKDFINVVYYETWYDTTNQQFLSAVGQELEVSVRGVPFIVIGSDYFEGYGSQMNDSIIAKLTENKDNAKYVDVVDKVIKSSGIKPNTSNPEEGKDSKEDEKEESSKNDVIGIVILGITVVIIIIIIFTRHSDEDEDDDDSEDEKDEEETSDDDEDDEEEDLEEEESEEEPEEEKVKEAPKKNQANKSKKKKNNKKR